MDELEISGKRFISTRRAGKEHKYSSDYIGQLIRGRKVVGQKVGRSWYVDEKSLNEYLSQPRRAEDSGVLSEVPVEKEEVVEVVEEVVEKEEVVTAPEEIVEERIVPMRSERRMPREEDSHFIPITIKNKKESNRGLVYLNDDEPILPPIEKRTSRNVISRRVVQIEAPPVMEEEAEENEERVFTPVVRQHKGGMIVRSIAIVGVGIIVLVVVAGVSTWVTSTTTVEEGKPASVQYSLK